jgi:hypothetical protein
VFKAGLEAAGYTLIPWSKFEDAPLGFWTEAGNTMADDSDDDLYGDGPATEQKETVKKEQTASSEDEPMDEESGDDSDDSVCRKPYTAFSYTPS